MEKTFTDTTMLLAAHLAEASLELSPTITGNRGSHGSTHSQGSTEVTLALPSSSITGRKAARSLRIFRGTAEDVKGKLACGIDSVVETIEFSHCRLFCNHDFFYEQYHQH